jgi:undecaprenyl-diphosphatase
VIVGTLPLVAFAPLLKGPLEHVVRDPLLGPLMVGVCLLVTAVLLASTRGRDTGELPVSARLALVIGLVQCVAVLPGISRSGSTIAAAILLGVSRAQAARFSFLLAIPAILGAVVLHVRELLQAPIAPEAVSAYAIAFIVAFGSGWLALLLLIRLVERGKLAWFAPYCAVVGLLALGWCVRAYA